MIEIKGDRLTCGLAQAGQWLARKFVRIWKFCARPNGSEAPPAPSEGTEKGPYLRDIKKR